MAKPSTGSERGRASSGLAGLRDGGRDVLSQARPDWFAETLGGGDAWWADLSDAEREELAEFEEDVQLGKRAAGTFGRAGTRAFASGLTEYGELGAEETVPDLAGGGAEAIWAGFTHADPARTTVGFAGGGSLDQLPPGTVLAGFVDEALSTGLGRLTDDELFGFICAVRRLSSRRAAMELAAVAEVDARRQREAARPGISRISEHVSEELAAALTLTSRSADTLLCAARDLARLPGIAAALAAGRIDRARALVFGAELAQVDGPTAGAVSARLCVPAENMTTGQLRAAIRKMVYAIDPAAVRRRAEKARGDARVEAWQESSGNGGLAGRELPAAEMIAADKRIDAIAHSLKSAGAQGNMDQLRAAVFSALLNGRDPAGLLPSGGCAVDMAPRGTRTSVGQSGADHGSLLAMAGSVNLTLPLSTFLGMSDAPGEVAGVGPLEAGTCRDLADRLDSPGNRWCVTVTGLDGRAVAHACSRELPERFRDAGQGCRKSWQGGARGSGSPGEHSPGEQEPVAVPRLESRAGAGPSGRPPRYGPRRPSVSVPPSGVARPGEHSRRGMSSLLAGVKLTWLEHGTCAHRRQASSYRPGDGLRHLVKVRQRVCAFPGCRRPAEACDDDHTVPFEQGGRTCECNLAALCRRHHRAKQAPGWKLEQTEPGVLTWTLPHGRHYIVRSGSY